MTQQGPSDEQVRLQKEKSQMKMKRKLDLFMQDHDSDTDVAREDEVFHSFSKLDGGSDNGEEVRSLDFEGVENAIHEIMFDQGLTLSDDEERILESNIRATWSKYSENERLDTKFSTDFLKDVMKIDVNEDGSAPDD